MNTKFLFLCSSFLWLSTASASLFTWELFRNPSRAEVLLQSSSSVAEELLRSLEMLPGKRRILELGAGMGAVTHAIVNSLRPGDILDVVEVNEVYSAHLLEDFAHIPAVKIHCVDALTYKTVEQYDVIICTLPLTMFSRGELQQFFDQMLALMRPGGYLSFIEYMLISRIRRMLQTEQARLVFDQKLESIARFKDDYLLVTKKVLGNLPPLYVHHLCIEQQHKIITSDNQLLLTQNEKQD